MPEKVQLVISPHAGLWRLVAPGSPTHDFSHLEKATHEAVVRARVLEASGEPAEVWVEAADGARIAIDVDPGVTQEQERNGPATPIDVAVERP